MEDTMRDLLSKLDQILNESVEVKETDSNKKDSWMRSPEDPESKIPAAFRKSKQAGKDSAKKSIDDLNKTAGAKVWRSAREDQDVDESGLQYHIGKKKYGKDGMKALAQAGRDGADEEDLGRIKDKFKKEEFEIGDAFGISISEDFEIGAEIVDILEDGVVIELDETAIDYLSENGFTFDEGEIFEGEQHGNSKIYDKCWKGYKKVPGKKRGEPGSCKKIGEELDEAEYQGRKVPLGKPMKGDVKKSKVYVKNPKGNVVKVNFGDKNMKIKKSNPARKKSFRARHNCSNPGPRHKARYWSCRAW
jgi:hypothetical protein